MSRVSVPESLRQLGVDLPICQALIGSLASAELSAAVAEAGGLGHVASTWRPLDDIYALFRRVRSLNGPNYLAPSSPTSFPGVP